MVAFGTQICLTVISLLQVFLGPPLWDICVVGTYSLYAYDDESSAPVRLLSQVGNHISVVVCSKLDFQFVPQSCASSYIIPLQPICALGVLVVVLFSEVMYACDGFAIEVGVQHSSDAVYIVMCLRRSTIYSCYFMLLDNVQLVCDVVSFHVVHGSFNTVFSHRSGWSTWLSCMLLMI